MSRCRFVQPDVVRLALSDGDFLDVKRELNAGEERAVYAGLVKEMRAGAPTILDPAQVGKTRILQYVVSWSLTDAEGRPVPFSEDALLTLDVDTYQEIMRAVDDHDAANDRAREEKKRIRAGSPVPVSISESPA